jgi:hypothetical protein
MVAFGCMGLGVECIDKLQNIGRCGPWGCQKEENKYILDGGQGHRWSRRTSRTAEGDLRQNEINQVSKAGCHGKSVILDVFYGCREREREMERKEKRKEKRRRRGRRAGLERTTKTDSHVNV